MIRNKKTNIVDDFILKLRSYPALQAHWVVDDLEVVLEALFHSDDERAIEISDEIRDVIERKHLSIQRRIAMIEEILQVRSIHLP
jgi:hypothetical protein